LDRGIKLEQRERTIEELLRNQQFNQGRLQLDREGLSVQRERGMEPKRTRRGQLDWEREEPSQG
jgi:hypothetical protein